MIFTMNPFSELQKIQHDVDSFFNHNGCAVRRTSYPLTNVYESPDAVTIVTELPGVRKEDVSITLNNDVVTISGKKVKADYGKETEILRKERSEGEFEKSIKMPYRVVESEITASLKNGLLTVKLPKAEEAKPKTIQISE